MAGSQQDVAAQIADQLDLLNKKVPTGKLGTAAASHISSGDEFLSWAKSKVADEFNDVVDTVEEDTGTDSISGLPKQRPTSVSANTADTASAHETTFTNTFGAKGKELEPESHERTPDHSGYSSARSSIYSDKVEVKEDGSSPHKTETAPLTDQSPADKQADKNDKKSFWQKSFKEKLNTIKSKFTDYTNIDLGNKKFSEKTFSEKMKYLGVKTLYYTTGIDIKKSKPLAPGEKELTTTQKIFKYSFTFVIAIASGMTTAVQFLASPHSLFINITIALLGWAGYRVNFGVYNSTIDYTIKSFFVEGPLNEFDKETGRWKRMSLKKCIAILAGTTINFLGSIALTAFTFTSVKAGLILFGIAGTACPPLLLALTIVISAISFAAIFTLMYKSMHSGIRDDKFDGLIAFFKSAYNFFTNIFNPEYKLFTKQNFINAVSNFFTFAGVSCAVVATLATLGAWYNNLIKDIISINPVLSGAAQVVSLILVFGFTAAGRIPMVIDVAAAVFSSIGYKVGELLVSMGEGLASFGKKIGSLFTKNVTEEQQTDKQPSLLETIKSQCYVNQQFSITNTAIFAGKVALITLGTALLATLVVGSVFLNAAGNGKVADEGGSVLSKMLGWFNIHPSPTVQSGLPYFAGGFFSATLGLNTVNSDFELADLSKKTQPPSSTKQVISAIGAPSPTTTSLTASSSEDAKQTDNPSRETTKQVKRAKKRDTKSCWGLSWDSFRKPTSRAPINVVDDRKPLLDPYNPKPIN